MTQAMNGASQSHEILREPNDGSGAATIEDLLVLHKAGGFDVPKELLGVPSLKLEDTISRGIYTQEQADNLKDIAVQNLLRGGPVEFPQVVMLDTLLSQAVGGIAREQVIQVATANAAARMAQLTGRLNSPERNARQGPNAAV